MKAKFYDITKKKSVEVEVTEKLTKSRGNSVTHFFKGLSDDGRPLLTMVSQKAYQEAASVPEAK